jgi:uncharacterized protein
MKDQTTKDTGTSTSNDRKLGNEWIDWDGHEDPSTADVNEHPAVFSKLAAGALLMWMASFQLAWYMMRPRVEQFSPFASQFLDWSLVGLISTVLVITVVEVIMLLGFKRTFFPYRWSESLLLSLLPEATWLGRKYGISRDRVSNSFIKVHNLLLRSHGGAVDTSRPLILLPRCLKKDVRRMVIDRIEGMDAKVVTAGGGEDARNAIREFQPSVIVAIACERDLVSGMKDVAKKIPVLAITNRRPEGPCKNTFLNDEQLEEAVAFLANESKTWRRRSEGADLPKK